MEVVQRGSWITQGWAEALALPERVRLYLETARYFRPSQIMARLALYARRRSIHRLPHLLEWRYKPAPDEVVPASEPLLPFDPEAVAQTLAGSQHLAEVRRRLDELFSGQFTFMERPVHFSDGIAWSAPGQARLWLYKLHYFAWVWGLVLASACQGDGTPYEYFRRLATDWIESNPIARGVGWHSYPLALRLVNWIYAAEAFKTHLEADEKFAGRFWTSLFTQARFLADHLEWDCRGNHLFENGRALLVAGLFFQGSQAARWVRKGMRIIAKAMEEQILPDGCHFERSPMYHTIVLKGCLEIAAIARVRLVALPERFVEKLRAMVEFAIAFRHPDGRIPLFGDSAFEDTPVLEELLPAAAVLLGEPRYKGLAKRFSPFAAFFLGRKGAEAFAALGDGGGLASIDVEAFPAARFFLFPHGSGNVLIFDGGEIGPDEVPAHGHCNTFGYELSVGGRRVVVDSGVETYEPGEWRNFYRSTRAHNTLTVDGLEQSETWAAFRVARRARVSGARWGISPALAWFSASHDGFCRVVRGLCHRRLVVSIPAVLWLIADLVWGATGEHNIESFVHLHPDFGASPTADPHGPLAIATPGEAPVLSVLPFGFDPPVVVSRGTQPLQGWYSPQFGLRLPSSVIIFRRRAKLPHLCGYVLLPGPVSSVSIEAKRENTRETYRVSSDGVAYSIAYTGESASLQS